MCKSLKLTYWVLSKVNHKLKFCEKYHCFINKTQKINSNDIGTHNVLIKKLKLRMFCCKLLGDNIKDWTYANSINLVDRQIYAQHNDF